MEPHEKSAVGAEMVRSEERLRVRMRRVPFERVVVRKVVVTEERTITVLLRHEELRLERTPVDDPEGSIETGVGVDPAGDRLVLDLVLHREVPRVAMRTVPYERVSVTTQVVTELEEVTGDVRSERVTFEIRPTDHAET